MPTKPVKTTEFKAYQKKVDTDINKIKKDIGKIIEVLGIHDVALKDKSQEEKKGKRLRKKRAKKKVEA